MSVKKGKVVAIVPSAGIGKRFSKNENKTFFTIFNKPLIIWTLEALHQIDEISEIIPVLRQDDLLFGSELIDKYNLTKVKRISPGGRERQDSVYNALRYLDDNIEVVLIHDGARPFIRGDIAKRAINELSGFDGVVVGVPVKDTIKEAMTQRTEDDLTYQGEFIVNKTLNRNLLWSIQTPQVFYFKKLMEAYEKAISEGFYATDDSSLIERYGGKVKIIMGSYNNIKITTSDDICIAEAILKEVKV